MKTDTRAMSVATALFFMVGFLTCLNDIVSPHLKSIFALDYAQTQSIPFFFFSSYFVFSYPAGKIVERFGYKKSMVVGLFVMALGALGFLPAAHLATFALFLAALVILAAGMTVVQVAINPYVTVIGPAATASSRLNLAQAFNSVGTFIAPFIGTYLILRNTMAPATREQLLAMTAVQRQAYRVLQASTVQTPYLIITIGLVLLALALAAIKLKPQTGHTDLTQDFRPGAFAEALSAPSSIWKHKWVIFGALGIFTYVGAEVSIGNLLVNYMGLPQIAGLRESIAGYFLMCYWGGAMLGRFVGSAVLQRVRTGPVLTVAAIGAFTLVVISLLTHGHLAMIAMLAVGFCNSIMFPSIFTLGIQDLGPLTSKGSSILIGAILGGAIVPKLQGIVADHIGLHRSFFIPAICYIYIAAFAFAAIKRPPARDSLLPVEPV
ncbi:sugar MFS transporter [Granulicella sp. L46]|uniref:sugar MFS transporter n=1 Tax=Granulicella sp. L46 TaxID=1641865 RepID=UPI0015761056|nr:sugar MFS transporter [Granulicella sp. L46]